MSDIHIETHDEGTGFSCRIKGSDLYLVLPEGWPENFLVAFCKGLRLESFSKFSTQHRTKLWTFYRFEDVKHYPTAITYALMDLMPLGCEAECSFDAHELSRRYKVELWMAKLRLQLFKGI